jgi:hypothetical protein
MTHVMGNPWKRTFTLGLCFLDHVFTPLSFFLTLPLLLYLFSLFLHLQIPLKDKFGGENRPKNMVILWITLIYIHLHAPKHLHEVMEMYLIKFYISLM